MFSHRLHFKRLLTNIHYSPHEATHPVKTHPRLNNVISKTKITECMLLQQIALCEQKLEKLKLASQHPQQFKPLLDAGIEAYLEAASFLDDISQSYGKNDIPRYFKKVNDLIDVTQKAIKVIELHASPQQAITQDAEKLRQQLFKATHKIKTHSNAFKKIGLVCLLGAFACLCFLAGSLSCGIAVPLVLAGACLYIKGMAPNPAPAFFKIATTAKNIQKIATRDDTQEYLVKKPGV